LEREKEGRAKSSKGEKRKGEAVENGGPPSLLYFTFQFYIYLPFSFLPLLFSSSLSWHTNREG
jgi:hypothetical protein